MNIGFPYERIYEGLEQIRLLKVARAATTQHDALPVIDVSMSIASFSEKPIYHTLSYCWGDPSHPDTIILNGKPFQVTRNLHCALTHLVNDSSIHLLWIDAISMNQNDAVEKNWQIPQMGRIFESASHVVIWLGASSPMTDLAMSQLESIGKEAAAAGILSAIRKKRYQIGLNEKIRQCLETGYKSTHPLVTSIVRLATLEKLQEETTQIAISELLDREIWHRAWVFQEIALANDAYLLCGATKLCLTFLDAALSAIASCITNMHLISKPLDRCFLHLRQELIHIASLDARRSRLRGKSPLLAQLLFRGYHLEGTHFAIRATEANDVVYALLSISRDTSIRRDIAGDPIDPKINVRVNTQWPAQQVYSEITKALIKDCRYYRFEHCCFPKDMPGLPSWVPDFQRVAEKGLTCHPISFWDCFYATGDLDQSIQETGPGFEVLLRRGVCVDSIQTVGPSQEWVEDRIKVRGGQKTISQGWKVKSLAEWVVAIHNFAVRSSRPMEETWQASVAGLHRGNQAQEKISRLGEDWFEALHWMLSGVVDLSAVEKPFWGVSADSRTEEFQHMRGRAQEIILRTMWAGYGRVLFQTKSGSIGLGPSHAVPGDIVAIIYGTKTPIILRSINGRQVQLVGESYVHGIMDGEALELNHDSQIFEIV